MVRKISDLKWIFKNVVLNLQDLLRQKKVVARAILLFVFAGLVLLIAPTVAEESALQLPETQSSQEVDTATAQTLTDTSTSVTIDTSTIIATSSTKSDTNSVTTTDTSVVKVVIDTAVPSAIQPAFKIRIPSSLMVDPRATVKFIPQIEITGSQFVLICLNANNLNFDLATKHSSTIINKGELLINGDQSNSLQISGTLINVLSVMNSEGGLMVYGKSTGIANSAFALRAVGMDHPANKPSYCDAAKTISWVSLVPLGLDLNTVKNGINLK